MKSNPYNRQWAARSTDPSPAKVFEALSHEHRQYILEYLVHRPGAVALGDLTEYIAIKEGEPNSEGSRRVSVGLYHVHLPHLAAAGLISYDVVRETVDLRVNASDIQPFLQLTTVPISQLQDDRD